MGNFSNNILKWLYFQNYKVLYTNQKTRKRKIWQDGVLRVSATKILLYEDSNTKILDSEMLGNRHFNIGDEIDMEKYMVTIESELSINSFREQVQPQDRFTDHISYAKYLPSSINIAASKKIPMRGNSIMTGFRPPLLKPRYIYLYA